MLPDQSIGVPSSKVSLDWKYLCAGKVILPIDIIEFKKDMEDL
jgi:hypothetical protein